MRALLAAAESKLPGRSLGSRRRPLLAGLVAGLALSVLGAAPVDLAGAAPPRLPVAASPRYLLALGDSLASGYEPTFARQLPPIDPATGEPDGGYPGGYAADLARRTHLRLVDLACPGETTFSMVRSPAEAPCATLYRNVLSSTSQLNAAVHFLGTHRGGVALVTFDLGANNVDGCLRAASLDLACVEHGISTVSSQLPPILTRLTRVLRAEDPGAQLVAMNYYDPFLALAFDPGGARGIAAAGLSVAGIDYFNSALGRAYHHAGIRVADVAGSFDTSSVFPIETYSGRRLARDAAVVCTLTWMCPTVAGRTAQDIHPNTAGYATIASAFQRVLRPLR